MSIRPLSFLAAAMLSLAAACHSTTEPAPLEVFVLRSVDGRPLPTTRSNDPSSNGATILHEELTLDAQGVATRSTTVQGATTATQSTNTVTYAYTRNGDVVTLGNVLCGPGALCIQHTPEKGSIVLDELTLFPEATPGLGTGSILVYQRLIGILD